MTEERWIPHRNAVNASKFGGSLNIPRDYVPAERRLVAEWAQQTYPTALKMFNLRLGAGQPTIADSGMDPAVWAGTVGNLRRFADCVVVLPHELLLVEAKIVAKPDAVGQLLLYRDLLPHTPEIADLARMPIHSALLCAVEDPAVAMMAKKQDIDVIVFHPTWVDDYLAGKLHRKREGSVLDAGLPTEREGTS